jgi:branched-chain amino acid transport system ATP-binding protein
MPLLEIDSVTKRFAGLIAVDQCSFQVEQGAIHALIGPNGAGKTTMFNLIGGALNPTSGRIVFDGQDLVGKPPFARNRLGIARTFQLISLFNEMSVIENVMSGSYCRTRAGLFSSLAQTPSARREQRKTEEKAREILRFVRLGASMGDGSTLARKLSYGEQRILEIARALASDPKLLLLDEPAAGMNPTEKVRLSEMIRQVRDQGVTVLIVEHDMRLIMDVADTITVLDHGIRIAEGAPEKVRNHPKVVEAYLGKGAA